MAWIEVPVTVRGGLPIIARADVMKYDISEYPDDDDYIDDLELLWPSGHTCHLDLSPKDDQRVTDLVMAAWRQKDWN